jgi:hypothetical protein
MMTSSSTTRCLFPHHLSRVLHPDLKCWIKSSLLTGVVSPLAGAFAATTTSLLLLLLLLLLPRRAATLHAWHLTALGADKLLAS